MNFTIYCNYELYNPQQLLTVWKVVNMNYMVDSEYELPGIPSTGYMSSMIYCWYELYDPSKYELYDPRKYVLYDRLWTIWLM